MRIKQLIVLTAVAYTGVSPAVSQVSPSINAPIDTFNYILGTQTIGVKYQFTEATRLVETAIKRLTP